ncbi:ATP synthase F1 subunit gamma [Hydrogenibacillus schlegelii]|uniref:ATP synthase gamma chain n=1 Tax=Hydrogenibacillus schlegelii TaxID=1484 RepID=A0A132N9E5_HYDSH|nr:ATP synthase F1 subunit gamma [Hydrogenibacillus schlegelii]KWX06749.1 ATP F0F1 synthase subunit gamma [Hydrogenibacillus schlegelii]MBT9282184.1 ATP synthase F1 subunit gamma [Hydrogenibacillus schlegelii]OAR04210.1 ATP F0F1 synthase subunit gamma [Hydrogenibacillus schlegelii]PTQ54565.1 MAG: ATP synthase gamma chain [Hydrogenibacillus schlegelii]
MAKGLRELRARIRSIKNTQQITKAMKLVSASKLRRAQERAAASRPYAEKMQEIIRSIARGAAGVRHPMLEGREIRRRGYVVITSDRGLAGGYNANLLRAFHREVAALDRDAYVVVAIGRKGRDYLVKRGFPVRDEITGLSDFPEYPDIQALAERTVRLFADGEVDALILVYNEFISPLVQRPKLVRLLPLTQEALHGSASPVGEGARPDGGRAEAPALYEFEPSPEGVLAALLPRYAEALIFNALLEAKAGEHAARMTAMGAATDAAAEMIESYTLELNRARQAAITQEIAEIVGGANALAASR